MKNKLANKAIELFHKIESPNEIIGILLLNACAQLQNDQSLTLIRKFLSTMPKSFYSNSFLLASLLDALTKCGDLTAAEKLFEKIDRKTMHMYGAMMNGKKNVYSSFSFCYLIDFRLFEE